jgi:hypothetical protein
MRAQKGTSTTVVALAGAAGLLALVNWYLLASPIDTSPVVPRAGKAEAPHLSGSGLATALDKKPAAQFEETVGRPLFHPTRRPVPDGDAAKEAPDELPDMRLVGVMKTGGQPARALIRFASEPSGRWLSEGEEYNGWRVRRVGARSAIVEGGGRSHELVLSSPRRASDDAAPGSEQNR